MFVLDSHCDTPTMMMRGRDIGKNNSRGHVDLPKLKAGGVDASFSPCTPLLIWLRMPPHDMRWR